MLETKSTLSVVLLALLLISSPLHAETMQAVLGADVMMGNDPDCRQWIAKYREPSADGEVRGRGGRRRRRRG